MIKQLVAGAILTFGLLLVVCMPLTVKAQGLGQACDISATSTLCTENNARPGGSGIIGALRSIANMVSIVAGIAGVAMVMLGGFRYIRSSGDPGKLSEAQSTIIYALIGLIVAAAGQLLVAFVLNRL